MISKQHLAVLCSKTGGEALLARIFIMRLCADAVLGGNMTYYLTVLGRQIPIYGLLFYGGILVAAIVGILLAKRRALPRYDIVYSAVYAMIGALIGAKLLFVVTAMEEIIRLQLSLLAVIKGGFVFYGGFLGGLLGLWLYTKQFRMSIKPFLDVYAVALPLGHAIGRVGCFFAGCCYGVAHDGPFSVVYQQAAGNTPLGTPLLATQLIEAGGLLLLFFAQLLILFRCKKEGVPTLFYAFAYPVLRFTLEFFRGDAERGHFGVLSTSQWISLGIFLVAFGILLYRLTQKKKAAHP